MNRNERAKAAKFWATAKVLHVYDGQVRTEILSSASFEDSDLRIYIGQVNGEHYFAVNAPFDAESKNMREISTEISDETLEIYVTALALCNWHERHPRCPRCGSATEVIQNGWVRRCPADGTDHFPRTDPAIIVAVQDRHGRLCLGHQASWQEGRYSNFAGFVEPGETLEAAVIREVKEESNLDVVEIKYLMSQPWPFPNSMMLAFEAFTDSPELAAADGEEIADLKWFTREDLIEAVKSKVINTPPLTSVSGKMIQMWLNGKR